MDFWTMSVWTHNGLQDFKMLIADTIPKFQLFLKYSNKEAEW